jgi:hypothetical protein
MAARWPAALPRAALRHAAGALPCRRAAASQRALLPPRPALACSPCHDSDLWGTQLLLSTSLDRPSCRAPSPRHSCSAGFAAVAPARVAAAAKSRAHASRSGAVVCAGAATPGSWRCELCKKTLTSANEYAAHLKSRSHAKRVAHLARSKEVGAAAEAALQSLPKLNAWRARLLPDSEPFTSLRQARTALHRVHINLFDLVEGRFGPVFKSEEQLRDYCHKRGLIFPLSEAKATKHLKLFLRHLLL